MVPVPNLDDRSICGLSKRHHQTRNHHRYQTGGPELATKPNGSGETCTLSSQPARNFERKAWGIPESSGWTFRRGEGERNYPAEESEKHHCDVERRHDEKIENGVLENRSHQPVQARLAVTSFEFQDEDDDANESNEVCGDAELSKCLR